MTKAAISTIIPRLDRLGLGAAPGAVHRGKETVFLSFPFADSASRLVLTMSLSCLSIRVLERQSGHRFSSCQWQLRALNSRAEECNLGRAHKLAPLSTRTGWTVGDDFDCQLFFFASRSQC
jgi:hypothetical protein